jgi:hypothetical protein
MRELTVAEQRYQAVLAVISDGLAVSLVAQKAGVSRLGAEQSAKLCVQYLAPIFKNRQYNFFPIGGIPVDAGAPRCTGSGVVKSTHGLGGVHPAQPVSR